MNEFELSVIDYRELVRKQTLKEVGALVEKRLGKRWEYQLPPWSITISPTDIETFLKGEMPD